MDENVRPDDMERITTPELAQAFIDEQVAAIREQVGDKKVLLALSGGGVAAFGATKDMLTAELLHRLYGVDAAMLETEHGPAIVPKGGEDDVPLDG